MKKYKFLLKPLFSIFNLLFASWLVLKIESMSPSDFGKYKGFLSGEAKPAIILGRNKVDSLENIKKLPLTIGLSKTGKQYLHKLCSEYKACLIDSTRLDYKLDFFFEASKEAYSIKITE